MPLLCLLTGCGQGAIALTGELALDGAPDALFGADVGPGNDDAGSFDPVPGVEPWPGVARDPIVVYPEVAVHVRSGDQATRSFADAQRLWIDQEVNGVVAQGYLRFGIGQVGSIARAVVHLYINDGSKDSFDVNLLADTEIDPSMTWETRPTEEGTPVATLNETAVDRWVEIDVTSLVHPGLPLTLALVPRSADGVGVVSASAASHRPKLVLEVGAALPPNAIEPEADTFVRSGSFADRTFDHLAHLDVDGDADGTEKQAFLRFRVGAVSPIHRAVLRLYLLNGSGNSAKVVLIDDTVFGEDLAWNSKPSTDGPTVAALSATARGWVELELTGHVMPRSVVSLALLPASGDGVRIASAERPFYRPHLVLTAADATCGDRRCDAGETCQSCAEDCGACPAGCLAGELIAVAGDMHAHTSHSDGEGTPAGAFKHARSRLDFLIITDHHSKLTSAERNSCRAAANDANTRGKFVAMCGWESTIRPGDVLGHSNVFFAASLSALPNVDGYAAYYTKLAGCTGCVGQINHPASDRFGWASYAYKAKAADSLALQEFNGAGSIEDKIAMYASGLDHQWRLAPTWNSDTHKSNWGEKPVRSGFWVTALGRGSLTEAVRQRRGFASNDRDARLRVRTGACWPGSDLARGSIALVEVLATDPTDGFARIVLVGPGNKALKVFQCGGEKVCAGTALVQVTAASYAFAYAVQKDGDRVIAAPVWSSP